MKIFLIKDTIQPTNLQEVYDAPYIMILDEKEWQHYSSQFKIEVDIDINFNEIFVSEAVINHESISGTFCIPDRKKLDTDNKFMFILNENGIIFIDNENTVINYLEAIISTKRWKFASLERFLFDFLDQIIIKDTRLLESYEKSMRLMEDEIILDKQNVTYDKVSKMRNDIQTLKEHYEQLSDMALIFEDDENDFFNDENYRYFRMFFNRVERLKEKANGLQQYTIAIRELYKTHLDIKQNRVMTLLTLVTTMFYPLTLITGWYGMNFSNMPELAHPLGYPIVIIVSIIIVSTILFLFKKKKWI